MRAVPKRILHLGKYYPPVPGGVERFVADLADAQALAGHAVAVLVHRKRAQTPRARDTGPQIVEAPTWGTLWYAPISPAYPLILRRLIRQWRPDVIHVHMPNTSAFWLLALVSSRRVPVVVHWHADVVASQLDWRLRLAYRVYRPLERALLKRAAIVVPTSPPYLESSEALKAVRASCRPVPLGLNPLRLPTPSGTDPWTAAAGTRILAVGRLAYYKGFDTLIRALAQTPQLSLALIGEGPERTRLVRLVGQLGLGGRVRLCGALDDRTLAAWLAQCDVLCLPSVERTEAFGVVLLEAMRYAKPVVVTDIPGSGVRWVVDTAGHGLVVPLADPQALAQALMRLSGDPALRRRLGAAGEHALVRRFAIDAVARELDGVYDAACSSSSAISSAA